MAKLSANSKVVLKLELKGKLKIKIESPASENYSRSYFCLSKKIKGLP